MDSASTLSIYSHPKPTTTTTGACMLLRRRLFLSTSLHYVGSTRRRCSQFRTFVVKNDSSSSGRSGRGRRVYRESQSEAAPLTAVPVKEIASFVLPVGSFVVVTFVMWKLVEKLMMPKQAKAPAAEKKPTEGVKWSFAAGTNLLPNFGAKIERESKLRLNDFAKELRSFSIVDMSGRNFGDEGLFYLAESLGYNQTCTLERGAVTNYKEITVCCGCGV